MSTSTKTSPIDLILKIGENLDDAQEVRLQKSLLVVGSFMFITAGALWSIVYIIFQEPLAGLIPLSYSIVSFLSVVHFALTRQYRFFRSSQLVLILLLPFLLMLALGGYINSSAIILWSFICPLGALLFAEPSQAPRWQVVYLFLLALSGFLQPYVRLTNHLPQGLVIAFFILNIAAVSTIAFVLLHYFVRQKNLAGFTPLTNELSPTEMVELLNEIYSHFDYLIEKHAVEKIRTIGDNYMIASGLPQPRADHAHALARLALEMNAFISELPPVAGRRLSFRIGINSGPVIAGVIGSKKFAYDLWGDAVNTASRMESQGVPGKNQITQTTYELLKDDFICEPNGLLPVKGKGAMETWFLLGLHL
jgi:adenylate cyclase